MSAQQQPIDDADALYQVSAEVAKATVHDQLLELEGIRQRTVQFLAFVGSGTAFLVGTSLSGATRGQAFLLLGGVGSLGVLAVLVLCWSILTGKPSWWKPWEGARHWYGRLDARPYLEWLDGTPPLQRDFYRHLATTYTEQYENNKPYMRCIHQRYSAFLAVSVGVLLWWGVLAWLFGGSHG